MDTVLTLTCLVAALVAMILVAARLRPGRLDRRALWLVPGLWLLNSIAVLGGAALQHHYFGGSGLAWNWTGKLLGIVTTVLCLWLLPGVDRRAAGVTLRQNPGTFWPTLAVIVVACALGAWLKYHLGGAEKTVRETWLYELLMPSLDEELFNRGLLLFWLARGLGDSLGMRSWKVDLSVWIISLQFALEHAFGFVNGRAIFSLTAFLFVLYYGYLLGWARQRTGSVLLPMIAHTLSNTLSRLW